MYTLQLFDSCFVGSQDFFWPFKFDEIMFHNQTRNEFKSGDTVNPVFGYDVNKSNKLINTFILRCVFSSMFRFYFIRKKN